ncbi:hypothetical protein JL720_7838 [Aureococcus anophagefferens]|nr:hypothetical protein JL720_7838 [Aureococcus anophagefferens]
MLREMLRNDLREPGVKKRAQTSHARRRSLSPRLEEPAPPPTKAAKSPARAGGFGRQASLREPRRRAGAPAGSRGASASSGDAALDALLAKAARSRPVTAPDAWRRAGSASDGALDASDEADEDDDEPVLFGWRGCSFSADGALVVTGGDDKTVKLWNTGNGKLVRDIEEASYVTACKVSNKGDVIASSSTDNTCKLWDAFSGELLKTLDGHESFCLSCNFSPDGKRLMTTSDDQTAILDWILKCDWSHDGKRIVTASTDQTAALWDSERAEFQKEIKGHQGTVTSCAFSKDDKVVVTGSLDHTAKLWHSWRTDECIHTLDGHTDHVTCVAFSSDGTCVMTASRDHTAKIWQVARNKAADRSTLQRTVSDAQ